MVTVFYATTAAPDEAKQISFERIGQAEKYFLGWFWDICDSIYVRYQSGKCRWWKGEPRHD
jgi:hypothetical protein